MTPESASTILRSAVFDDRGAFTALRLGEDPGAERIKCLRLALRVLWRHCKTTDVVPFDIAQPAAVILHFRRESESNLRSSKCRLRAELNSDLNDLAQGAFELLCGRAAEDFVVRRPDLGE